MLVGSKITAAFIVDKTRSFFENRLYNIVMKVLGLVLFGFSILFIYDGFKILNSK